MYLFIAGGLLIALLVAVWLYGPDVRYVPTPRETARLMLTMAGAGPGTTVYDLGSGDGRLLFTAARDFGARAVGIEINPLRWLLGQVLITCHRVRGRVEIRLGRFFDLDLSEADIVACYLAPEANRKLTPKFNRELKPGARIVFYRFPFFDLVSLTGNKQARVFVYKVKGFRTEATQRQAAPDLDGRTRTGGTGFRQT